MSIYELFYQKQSQSGLSEIIYY